MTISIGLQVQRRVLWALMLREIHTINGNSYLGYLWVVIQGVVSIAIFWTLRELLNFHAPHGMSTPVFLIIGFGFWRTFSGIITKSIAAVSGNKNLLTFPQVTPLDLIISRMLVITATEITVASVMLVASQVMGYSIGPFNWLGVILSLFCISLLAFGIGLTTATFCYIVPTIIKIVPMILRIMFFCSGVFYSISRLPSRVFEILKWNPVLQVIELGRNSVAYYYNTNVVDYSYLAFLTIVFLFLGLLLERYGRRYAVETD